MKNYKFKVKRNARKNILGMRVMFKKCTKCGKVLFRNEFYTKKSPSGLMSSCIECLNSKYSHTCEQCGREYKSSNIKSRFCSQECKARWQSENQVGENNPNYNKVKCNCGHCGKEIEITKYRYNNIKNHFCSRECASKHRSVIYSGENSPTWKGGGITFNCDYCGKECNTTISHYNDCKNHFCSRECQGKWNSENLVGEKHPCYNPNLTQEEREQGRNIEGYRDFIKEVYKRDNYTCQCCGDNKGGNLNAHHIYGYAEYKDLRTDIDNLVTLCEDCHKRYHKQYGYTNNNYKDFRIFLYNEMMKQNTLEARLFYINTIEDITLRLEIRGLLELESA